jgi:uncharacterized protein YcgL (UPF0745 family)
MNNRLVTIYRSEREEGLYLYVDKTEDVSRIPESLLQQLGKMNVVMRLVLDPARKLARADASKVLNAIEAQGFYLQLPPAREISCP